MFNKNEILVMLDIIKLNLKSSMDQAGKIIIARKNYLYSYCMGAVMAFPYKSNMEFAVYFDSLYQVLMAIKDDWFDATIEKNCLVIVGGDVTAYIVLINQNNVYNDIIEPLLQYEKKAEYSDLPDDFNNALSTCLFSLGTTYGDPVLECILIDGRYVAATDSFRISEFKMKKHIDDMFLIHKDKVLPLMRFNAQKYSYKNGKIIFKCNDSGAFYCFATINEVDSFPNYVKILKQIKKKEGVEITFPEQLQETIKVSLIFINSDSPLDAAVVIKIEKKELTCISNNDNGKIIAKCAIEYSGPSLSFNINPMFFMDILQVTQNVTYCPNDNILFFESDKFQHVMALVVPNS